MQIKIAENSIQCDECGGTIPKGDKYVYSEEPPLNWPCFEHMSCLDYEKRVTADETKGS